MYLSPNFPERNDEYDLRKFNDYRKDNIKRKSLYE